MESDGDGGNVVPLLGAGLRQPPSNAMAEQALLGAIMATPKAFLAVEEFLKSEHFADPVHQRIFEAAAKRIRAGGTADAVTLRGEFDEAGVLREVGGMAYLAALQAAMISVRNAPEYGRAIRDAWVHRQMIDLGTEMVHQAFDPATNVEALITESHSRALALLEAAEAGNGRNHAISFIDAADRALTAADRAMQAGGPVGLSTGMASVDKVLGGLEPGTLNVLAGRPGSGKSALGMQWGVNAAQAGAGVLIFSLEMSAAALGRRALASLSGVPIWRMRSGEHADFTSDLIAARRQLSVLPLWIHEGGRMSMVEIAARAGAEKRKHKVGLIIVDHMHLVRYDDTSMRRGGPTAAVADVAHGMQGLAKQLELPVLLLAQLNRGPLNRDDHRPTMSDLRQSGAIEEDADTVMFIYRPEIHLPKSAPRQDEQETPSRYEARLAAYHDAKERDAGVAELICDKVREGEPRTVHLRFNGPTATFSEPAA